VPDRDPAGATARAALSVTPATGATVPAPSTADANRPDPSTSVAAGHGADAAPRGSTHLFVVPWPLDHPGGVNEVVTNLYRRFTQDGGPAPHVLVTSWPHRRALTALEDGRNVTRLRLRAPFSAGGRAAAPVKWALFLVPELVRLVRLMRRERVVVVNVHFPSLAVLPLALARSLVPRRADLVLSFHGLDLAQAEASRGVARWLWRVLLRRADALVACSAALRDRLAAFEPRAASRLVVIHNGVDPAHLLGTRNATARPDARLRGHRVILCVASYEHKKGLDVLMRAFAQLRAAGMTDLRLALVGPERGTGPSLRALAQSLGIAGEVVFCGPVAHADLHRYYEAATVFCLPSRAEPFGIVLLEAGVFRCPVVATSVDGIPEVVTHDVHARLVPPDDPAALAAALRALLDDPALRARLSDALHERVRARFGWDRASAAYRRCAEAARATSHTDGARPADDQAGNPSSPRG
jgi:glycosyltransferase involved in cell wall biosynthesis